MPITRRVYDVHLNPEGYDPATADPFDVEGVTTHRITVIHADQMVGEREALRRGVTFDQAQNMTSVIVWCALRRLGLYKGKYESFRDVDLLDIGNPDRSQEQEVEVPPTEEPSGSASNSHEPSPASESIG